MKFILMFIGIFSIFYTGLSLKCYTCDDRTEITCDDPIFYVCPSGETLCKTITTTVGKFVVIRKGCGSKFHEPCDLNDENGTGNCCGGDLCNGSETILKNSFLFWSFLLFSISKLLF